MSIKQISVFVENKPGALYALTAVLAQGQIDMRALSLAETKDFGIVRLIVNDLYKATTLLKDAGYVHSLTPVVGVAIPDVPGGLNRVLQVLTDAKVNVEYMYAFLGGKDVDHAYMIFRVADDKAAETALASRGMSRWSGFDPADKTIKRTLEHAPVSFFAYHRAGGRGSLCGPYTIREHTSSAYSDGSGPQKQAFVGTHGISCGAEVNSARAPPHLRRRRPPPRIWAMRRCPVFLHHQRAHQFRISGGVLQGQVGQQEGLAVEQLGILLHGGLIAGVHRLFQGGVGGGVGVELQHPLSLHVLAALQLAHVALHLQGDGAVGGQAAGARLQDLGDGTGLPASAFSSASFFSSSVWGRASSAVADMNFLPSISPRACMTKSSTSSVQYRIS